MALGLCVQLLGQAGFPRALGSVGGWRWAFFGGVELLDDGARVVLAVLEDAIAEATLSRFIQSGLVKASCLPLCIELIGGQQRLRHAHTAAYRQVDVEDRRPMALPGGLPAQTQLQRQAGLGCSGRRCASIASRPVC
jgi:hypothetical protein